MVLQKGNSLFEISLFDKSGKEYSCFLPQCPKEEGTALTEEADRPDPIFYVDSDAGRVNAYEIKGLHGERIGLEIIDANDARVRYGYDMGRRKDVVYVFAPGADEPCETLYFGEA